MRGFIGLVTAVALLAGAPGAAAEVRATVDRVKVEASDGVKLAGWIIRPEEAPKKGLPVILVSSPYIGQCIRAGGPGPCWPRPRTPEEWAEHNEPIEHLVSQGYAMAYFSVRGTGASGGCLDDMGSREQRDQVELVKWLADRSWSSGRVALMGISYMSGTALGGAIHRPRALKTIVIGGVVGDLYTFTYSPQGLASAWATLGLEAPYITDISLTPAGAARGEPDMTAEGAAGHHERLCPEVAQAMTEGIKGSATAIRDASFWLERRLSDHYGRIRASVLVAHGFQDLWQSGHMMQEDDMWSRIRAPKAMYLGQWGHHWPWQEGHTRTTPRADLKAEWLGMLDAWLGHYLKGGPRPSFVGRVRYEDDGGAMHDSDAWPPAESRAQALYLRPDGALSGEPAPTEAGREFRSYPQMNRVSAPGGFLCPALADPVTGPGSLVYSTAPVTERTVIAGNPLAYLDLGSDQPGGGVQVTLHDLGPDFACSDPAGRTPAGALPLTLGGADLRFHGGGFVPRSFEGGHVRIDLANLAHVLEPGHRLAATVSYGDPAEFAETSHTPLVTVRSGPRADASQIVVPVLEGDLGGSGPAVQIPPRP